MTNEEIIGMLQEIKGICIGCNCHCISCPFGDKYGCCKLAELPETWKLNEPDTEVWRAFL